MKSGDLTQEDFIHAILHGCPLMDVNIYRQDKLLSAGNSYVEPHRAPLAYSYLWELYTFAIGPHGSSMRRVCMIPSHTAP